MKIDGFGQINAVDVYNTSKAKTDGTDFESALKKAYDEGDKAKLKEACDEFEALLLQMMYKQMKATIPDGGFIEKSSARSIFEDMLDEQLMENASKRGMGISDMMYKQLSANMDRIYKASSGNESPDSTGPEADEAEIAEK